MRVRELLENTDSEIAALAVYLADRIQDQESAGQMSMDAFIGLAGNLGISLDPTQVQQLVGKIPAISDANSERITFASAVNVDSPDAPSPDHARAMVSNMAKRAMRKPR